MEVKAWKDPVLRKVASCFKTGDRQEYATKKYNIHVRVESQIKKTILLFRYVRFACFKTAWGRHKCTM